MNSYKLVSAISPYSVILRIRTYKNNHKHYSVSESRFCLYGDKFIIVRDGEECIKKQTFARDHLDLKRP